MTESERLAAIPRDEERVLLGTGGVGYFEYAAEVDAGDSSLNLRARLDQVDNPAILGQAACPSSFMSQRDRRIDFHGPPRREIAR